MAVATKKAPRATKTFSAEEREAMEAAATEAKRARSGKADGEADIRAAFAKMGESDRKMAERIHAIVKQADPSLESKTWYGMPAYANADDKVVLAFKNAGKFGQRYSTLEFQDSATLDDGDLWPVGFAIRNWGPAVEKKVVALVKAAVS